MISIDGYWLAKKATIDIEPLLSIVPFCGFIFTDLINEYSLFCTNSKTVAHNSKILRVLLSVGYSDLEFHYVVNDVNKPKLEVKHFIDVNTNDSLSWVKELLTGSDLMDRRTEIFGEDTLTYKAEIFQDISGYISTHEKLVDKAALNNDELSEEVCLKLYVHSHELLHFGEVSENLKKYAITYEEPIIEPEISEPVETVVEQVQETVEESPTINTIEETITENHIVEETAIEETISEDSIDETRVTEEVVENTTIEEIVEETEEDNISEEETVEQAIEESTEDAIEETTNIVEETSTDDGPEIVVDNIESFTEPADIEPDEDEKPSEQVVEETVQEDLEPIENLTEEIPEPVVDTTEEVSSTIEPVIEERPVRQRKDYSTHPIYREMDELPVIQELHNLYKIIVPQNHTA